MLATMQEPNTTSTQPFILHRRVVDGFLTSRNIDPKLWHVPTCYWVKEEKAVTEATVMSTKDWPVAGQVHRCVER